MNFKKSPMDNINESKTKMLLYAIVIAVGFYGYLYFWSSILK
jgi:hypothetical protein